MRKFFIGFGAAIVVIFLAGIFYVRLGFINPRADIPISSLDKAIAMPSLDAAVDRRAPEVRNPLPPTDATLFAGMKVYQANCASCHGDIARPHGTFAEAFYPRAPQFLEDTPDMPENQNFYIIQHGIRFSGMPAWKQTLSDSEVWQVTAFLSHIDKLTPQVSAAWKAVSNSSAKGNASFR